MSEKLYKVTKAIDYFNDYNLTPDRCLVFMDSNGNRIKKFFPENRTTLFFKGELYDWYGKKVKIANGIKRIIKPFGYELGNSAHETYLVETENEKLTIANLCTISPCFYNPDYSIPVHVKNEITGGLILNGQELKCPDWYFEEFLEQPIENTCFKAFNYAYDYKILLGVFSKSLSESYPVILFYPYVARHLEKIVHCVFKDRASILQSPPKELNLNGNKSIFRAYTNYLCKKLSFSDDGNKATTYLSYNHGFDRISTDTEVLLHAKNNQNITWYYDPEP